MSIENGRYFMENYAKMEPFCSFLPGIAGEKGIPMWCYYVNRGQCITSFGVEDKNHAIMEFFPAHQAYQYTGTVGFRTFLKVFGQYREAFSDAALPHSMETGMNELIIREEGDGLNMTVTYFTVPEMRGAALVRRAEMENTSGSPMELEMLDGMPAILPFGVDLHSVKEMTQTAKAWMQAEKEDSVGYFRVRASMDDSSDIHQVLGVNFGAAFEMDGGRLPVFVDPRHIFGWDSSLKRPEGFLSMGYEDWAAAEEVTQNILPACFFGKKLLLQPGEKYCWYMVTGQAESKQRAGEMLALLGRAEEMENKLCRARELSLQLTDPIATRTGDPVFDMYCRQTYLDNLLRGGAPVMLPGGKMTYLYSRKHGDPERDYNFFRMRAEYYSQGNGNFRDVNQNRRCDVLFHPEVGERNIRTFYNLLQADGYNPLVVECVQYSLKAEDAEKLLEMVAPESRPEAQKLFAAPFTPGKLSMGLEEWKTLCDKEEVFEAVLRLSEEEVTATFGEGYWTDHWTYNLDQVESYLAVFPEKEESLLFGGEDYTYYRSNYGVLPRRKRYTVTPRGVRQYSFLQPVEGKDALLRSRDGKILRANLMEKLLTLLVVKASTLDPFGMGVEMEAGKPGWYDALNGLPGLLGSSVPETLELRRNLEYALSMVRRYGHGANLMEETGELAEAVQRILAEEDWRKEGQILPVWNRMSDAREEYRQKLKEGISGKKQLWDAPALEKLLSALLLYVTRGIEKAMQTAGGLCPTYFAYEVTKYRTDEEGLYPEAFWQVDMPAFLEGQVRYLRLDLAAEEKLRLVKAVKQSRLYDQKLKMYKVNAALSEAGYEIGRAHAFTPGWLENESVWLHMEYKYLLELLRAGLYEEFAAAFRDAAVPFLDAAVYGRSPLENSSFIASSANPDPAIHGKGFVARLSGSTAEMLSIWQRMLLGGSLFTMENGVLRLNLQPVLPKYLTGGVESISAKLMSRTEVTYHLQPGCSYYPGNYRIGTVEVTWRCGGQESFEAMPAGESAERIRRGEAAGIAVQLLK